MARERRKEWNRDARALARSNATRCSLASSSLPRMLKEYTNPSLKNPFGRGDDGDDDDAAAFLCHGARVRGYKCKRSASKCERPFHGYALTKVSRLLRCIRIDPDKYSRFLVLWRWVARGERCNSFWLPVCALMLARFILSVFAVVSEIRPKIECLRIAMFYITIALKLIYYKIFNSVLT